MARDDDEDEQTTSLSTVSLPTFSTTTAPCSSYHRGHAISIYGLELCHDGGRVLFQLPSSSLGEASLLFLPHGSITGVVGTNGCGKSSLAQVLASKQLDGFPADLMVEYLAAADDEDGHQFMNCTARIRCPVSTLKLECS
mmetsp:Transcript_14243/g.22993  ORF Transcript_14243/g.22993 Transcript_14243/m.22993 type:complete len:140 (+) Transcript_14243:108-527(+)